MPRLLAPLVGAFLTLAALLAPANAQEEFKIGVVMSLSGGFVAAAKDTMDGVQAWLKARGLPGKKVTFEILDDETRSEEHTSELQSPCNLVCRLLLEKKKKKTNSR